MAGNATKGCKLTKIKVFHMSPLEINPSPNIHVAVNFFLKLVNFFQPVRYLNNACAHPQGGSDFLGLKFWPKVIFLGL